MTTHCSGHFFATRMLAARDMGDEERGCWPWISGHWSVQVRLTPVRAEHGRSAKVDQSISASIARELPFG